MIAQAFSAEFYKLTHNRVVLFWAFLATPIASFLFGMLIEGAARGSRADMGGLGRIEPISDAWSGLGTSGNVIVQLLLILGASVLFGGEYRWETWRAIVPRSSRFALLSAKMGVFALASGLSILLCALASFGVSLFAAAFNGAAPTWPTAPTGAVISGLALTFLASLLQACLVGALTALSAVLTRSVLAATLVTFLIMLGQELAAGRISIIGASEIVAWIPTIGARGARAWGAQLMGAADAVGANLGPMGLAALFVWFAVVAMATLAAFLRQDLARE